MSKNLTNRQAEALIKLRDQGPRGAYPGISLGTLNSLSLRNLVSAEYGLGSMAMPHNSITWTITDACRYRLCGGLWRRNDRHGQNDEGSLRQGHFVHRCLDGKAAPMMYTRNWKAMAILLVLGLGVIGATKVIDWLWNWMGWAP